MKMQPHPKSCRRCGSTRVVALLWDHSFFSSTVQDAIATERAYLGLSHRYFTSVDPTLVVGKLVVKARDLPTWACLNCSPEWFEVHRLAGAELRAVVSKMTAFEAGDFEKAAALHGEECRLEASHVARYERLLRELIPSKGKDS
jgi:hypothetical protein